MVISALSALITTSATAFHCSPISAAWDIIDKTPLVDGHLARCLDINGGVWVHSVLNVALDIWLMIIPMPDLMKLPLPLKKKVKVGFMFTVGGL
jgi:hypothetical protein